MKKVRMIISAVAVFAVVGSALAFNTKAKGTFCVYQLNGSTCSFIHEASAVSSGTTIPNADFISKTGECPSSISAACNQTLDDVQE